MHLASIVSGGVLAALSLAAPVAAQAPAPGQAPIAWRSAFEGYQPHTEAPVASWREANDTVGRVGGWRAYAREAQAPAGSAPPAGTMQAPTGPMAPAATTPLPATAPAAGHRH